MLSLTPSSGLGRAPATPGIIPLVLEQAPRPHLPSVCLHTALPSAAVAGNSRCAGALICSTPGDQCLTFIQPQSYGSHTLCGLPRQREGGLQLPGVETGVLQLLGPPPSAAPGFRLPSFRGQISVHGLCAPNASQRETATNPSKMLAKRPVPTSAAPNSSPHAPVQCFAFFFVPIKVCGVTSFTEVAVQGGP